MKRSWIGRGVLGLVLVVAFAACAPARATPDPGAVAIETATDEDRELVVRVKNDLIPPTNLTVWLVPEASARRMLGTIAPRDTASFPLDALVDGRYRLLARTTTGSEVTSETFTPLIPGVVRWDVTANLVATTGLDEKRTPADEPPR